MPSMKDIKLRIKSVESTMQITKAMELVASSKLRRAKERVEQSRPYFETLYETLFNIAASNIEFTSPYMVKREVRRTCYVVIAGDRGLAGGYNSNMFKLIAAETQGRDYTVLPIGKKAVEHFDRLGVPLVSREFAVVADLSVSDCFQLSKLLAEGFLKGEYDEIKIGFTQFVSMLTQTPMLLLVLPFDKPPIKRDSPVRRDLMLYEPNSEEVFNAIIPEYLAGVVYGAMCESVASELGARRTAMDSATKNAGEMIESLNLYYNRARQAAITQEITEIVAGAEQ